MRIDGQMDITNLIGVLESALRWKLYFTIQRSEKKEITYSMVQSPS